MIRRIISKLVSLFNFQLLREPGINNAQFSVIIATESWNSSINHRLLDISIRAATYSPHVNHADIASKMIETPHWPEMWPGEHYKLLSALVRTLEPEIIIEIGTATGYSALAMKKFLKPGAKIYTFDIVPWQKFPNCILTFADFDDQLVQIVDDLSDHSVFNKYTNLLIKADFVFIDAAKDGYQEQVFINHFDSLNYLKQPIFMFDDIRLMNMISTWHNIQKPKIDLTSFGHWSGTGLVDWTATN